MDGVVGVRFTEVGPVSYCSPGELRPGLGDYVVVRTPRGERLGWVVFTPDQVLAAELEGPLRVIDRLASAEDVAQWQQQRSRAAEDLGSAQALAARTDPRVRVASLVYDLAGGFAELTFTAPERGEFGWLERRAADLLGASVEAQQVGDRDRAKALGGIGVCGLALCCSTWMVEFPAISMKMAKEQDLPPNPSKISGVCGRLLCCLAFEVEEYRELRGGLPKVGKRVTTPAGRAKVLSINSLKQVVRLRMEDTGEVVEIGADELRQQYGSAVRPEELEPAIEEPARRRERQYREAVVAVLEPVSQASGAVRAAVPAAVDADALDIDTDAGTGTDGAATAGEGERRRRRGRRGGRRRRRPDGATGEGGGSSETHDEGSANGANSGASAD